MCYLCNNNNRARKILCFVSLYIFIQRYTQNFLTKYHEVFITTYILAQEYRDMNRAISQQKGAPACSRAMNPEPPCDCLRTGAPISLSLGRSAELTRFLRYAHSQVSSSHRKAEPRLVFACSWKFARLPAAGSVTRRSRNSFLVDEGSQVTFADRLARRHSLL
jgi:hypothetical protein